MSRPSPDGGDGQNAAGGATAVPLDAFWRGEIGTLEEVYRSNARRMLATAGRVVGPVEAEAVVQDVFVEIIRNAELRRRFAGGQLGAWLAEIARRKGLEHRRRTGWTMQRNTATAAESLWPEPALVARDLVERFVEREVPEPQRRFFALRFLERWTQVEVAAALGLPRSTVEGWEQRFGARLRRFILEGT